MTLCKVVGFIVSTVKDPSLQSFKLLLCQEVDQSAKGKESPFVAVDTVGAGTGDMVLVVRGSTAQTVARAPVDAAIAAIVDTVKNS